MANNSATFSVIGPDVTIKGNVEASADLHVDGRVEGDLACQSLVQGEASLIEGNIKADRARLSGHVKGTIAAKELVILKTARVEGDVTYDTLTVEQGATVDGRFAPKGMKPEMRSSGQAARPATATPEAQGQAKADEPKLSLAGQ